MRYANFRKRLALANNPALYPLEWLDEQVKTGLARPIIGEDAAVVFGVRNYPGGARVGHVIAAAGDMEELVSSLAPQAEEMARRLGCSLAMIEGREGWKKIMHGWQTHQVVLVKGL